MIMIFMTASLVVGVENEIVENEISQKKTSLFSICMPWSQDQNVVAVIGKSVEVGEGNSMLWMSRNSTEPTLTLTWKSTACVCCSFQQNQLKVT